MAKTTWEIAGDYFETCTCDFVCPCVPSNLTARPTKGDCLFAFAFRVNRGHHGSVTLDGLNFALIGHTPGVMGEGNWSVGVIVDERATAEQQQAIVGIASGQSGGPMAAIAPLVGKILGVEKRPIRFEGSGLRRAVTIPGLVEQSVEGIPASARPGEPVSIDNTLHPANARLALAKSTGSHVHAFGFDWDDTTGRNNGHFAPFSWRG